MLKKFELRIVAATRLDELLRRQLPAFLDKPLSNSKIRRLIMAGAVTVNGRCCRKPAFFLARGSLLCVLIDEEKLFFEKDAGDIAFELTEKDVLYEDEAIILVNKPACFPTEAGMVESRDNLHDALVRYLWRQQPGLRNPPYAGIMHRLDRETSGVILFTKQRSANGPCHDMFEKHTAQKVYYAVSRIPAAARLSIPGLTADRGQVLALETGRPLALEPGLCFSVDMPMGRISKKSQAAKWGRLPLSAGGLPSHTDFRVLSLAPADRAGAANAGAGTAGSAAGSAKSADGSSKAVAGGDLLVCLECRPRTGRTHQIRVHLASLGLPILGDSLYGGFPAGRVHLHARSLAFLHPLTGAPMTVTAPLSADLEKIMTL